MSSSENKAYSPAAVLSENQWQLLNQAASSLDSQQLMWASGYLAGLAQANVQLPSSAAAPVAETSQASLTVLFGSQTGNAKGVAQEYAQSAEQAGFKVNVLSMADYKTRQLKSETHLVIVVSTHGEGEAPDDAVELHEFLASKKAPKLPQLKFAVLGLGDSSYEFFCQTAKDFEQRLLALGAESIHDRLDGDVDYDTVVGPWQEALNKKLESELKAVSPAQVVAMPGVDLAPVQNTYTKKSPFSATLIESQKITGRDSTKDIRHIEISLEDSGMQYQPGDALGVWFTNSPQLVDEMLKAVSLTGDEAVSLDEQELSLRQALLEKLELTQSYPGFLQALADLIGNDDLNKLLSDKAATRAYLAERQILDVAKEFPAQWAAQQLVEALRRISPRLYSIASSQQEVEDEVHLTVGLVEYDAFGAAHQGGASSFLCQRLEEGESVKVYVESNTNFRLPEDSGLPVIMIGPGTGIAPFRAFLQHRDMQEAEGDNWLFFGNPHYTQDFLYQVEIQGYVKSGLLNKVSLAFSRDQKEKIYVQDRIKEQGAEVYQWLERGAYIYVCGDANRMANDVNEALIEVVETHGGKSREEAEQFINDLRRAKRYQKDVY